MVCENIGTMFYVEIGSKRVSPDPRAIRLKYGRIGEEHGGEYVPHLHRSDKSQLSLTEDTTFAAFVHWLKTNVQPIFR